jgi:putative membrane protein
MKTLLLCAAACATLTIAACASAPTGEAAPIAQAAMSQPAPPAPEFVRMAGASDLYEIQSSQLVLQSTQNPDLQRFARMMVEHHTMTTAAVTRAAATDRVPGPPPSLDARKAEMLRQLQAADGEARDALYQQQQVMAHREALALHTSFAENGEATALKAAAATAVPIVARHYNMIVEMARAAGVSDS